MRVAVCCLMNNNRSMEVHRLLKREGFEIESFGTNEKIKIPGPTPTQPNEYEYKVSYEEIHADLIRKNEQLYRDSGLLNLLERNMQIKTCPEYFFEKEREFDLVITCEEKCFSTIFDHFSEIKPKNERLFYLINFDISDTLSDAVIGARHVAEFLSYFAENIDQGCKNACSIAIDQYCTKYGVKLLFAILERK